MSGDKFNMKQAKQAFVMYQGRKVELRHFRVYVYNKDAKLLVENYEDFQNAIKSGEWFETKAESLKVEIPVIETEKVKLVAVSDSKANEVKPNDANSKRLR